MTANSDLRSQADELARRPAVVHNSDEITLLVTEIVRSLKGDISVGDIHVYHELEGLIEVIRSTKEEIAAVRPDEIRERDIPLATDELDAVVGATEEATGVILDSCEMLESLVSSAEPELGNSITAAVTKIYEACNFQDVTSQRITKVVRTLRQIETRIESLLMAFSSFAGDHRSGERAAEQTVDTKTPDESLLNGPQLPDDAKRQADIDAIFFG